MKKFLLALLFLATPAWAEPSLLPLCDPGPFPCESGGAIQLWLRIGGDLWYPWPFLGTETGCIEGGDFLWDRIQSFDVNWRCVYTDGRPPEDPMPILPVCPQP